MTTEINTISKPEFDPKVKTYWFLQGIYIHSLLVFAALGVVSLPFWLLFGWFIVTKRFENLSVELDDDSINLKHGILVKVEKTIPLEKIQDLAMKTGPILNMFGLASISIETAGGGPQSGRDMVLSGIKNPEEFRARVLSQRTIAAGKGAPHRRTDSEMTDTAEVLTEIRDSLIRIEGLLSEKP